MNLSILQRTREFYENQAEEFNRLDNKYLELRNRFYRHFI